MNFKDSDVVKYVKNPDLRIKCVIIHGPNEGKIAEYCTQFAKTVCLDLTDAFRVVSLNMDTLSKDIGILFGEYNAQSLLGGRRVVIVKDVNDTLTKHIKELVADTKSDALLILTSSTLNTKSSLVNLGKDRDDFALVSCYDDREKDISSFVREYLIKSQITISDSAFGLLCARLSNDKKANSGEMDKLITYLGTKRNIEIDDVKTAISDTSSSSLEDLCYYIGCGYTEKAIDAYKELFNEGVEVVTITRSISNHFLNLLGYVATYEKNKRADEIISAIRPPVMFFRKDDLRLQISIWNKKSVLDVLDLLYQCEKDCKTTNFPAQQILSYTIMQICAASKRLRK
ncbi:MAG: DNA polymerase III subunit delta [Alphaproteobacteria bacterium]|nr:DNA polymerase III subunit delta [Alphaproteobacteria bacterium]